MTQSRWGSRYAIVASTLALFLALGGTAYAVNTVRSADIVNGTIKTEDLGTGSVRSIDIKNGAVAAADIAASSLGRSPAMWGRIEPIGETFDINRGGLDSVVQNSTGRFTIQAGRDITGCTYQVTPRVSGVSAGADEASTTAVNVYTDDISSGNPFQAAFDIVFFC